MKLNIYTDDTLTEISRVVEADKLKIPYRVSMYVIQSLDSVDFNDHDDVIRYVSQNIEYVDKIIRATFGLSEEELDCIETTELIDTAREIYEWVISKVGAINGGNSSKNV